MAIRDQWNQRVLERVTSEPCWETFHENSKTGRHDVFLPQPEIRRRMNQLWTSLPHTGYPRVELPPPLSELPKGMLETIRARVTARATEPCPISLVDLSTMLHCAYGVTRDNQGTIFPRPFRTVPSGGGLYPLELYLHITRTPGLSAGLYHYNASEHHLALLREGDETRQIAQGLVQPNLALDTSIIVFVTAMFERSTFKYRDRGYRFVLIEAGHVGQNLNLAATALDYGVVNIGGYFDRVMDDLLGIDGITHSTVYMQALGRRRPEAEATEFGA